MNTQGTLGTIKHALMFTDVDKTNHNWWKNKDSAFGADGSRVNMGESDGIGAGDRRTCPLIPLFDTQTGIGNVKHSKNTPKASMS